MNAATILQLLMSAVLPALRNALDNPAVREVLLNLVTRLLGQAQAQVHPRYVGMVPPATAPDEIPDLPHQEWTPEAVTEWAESKAT